MRNAYRGEKTKLIRRDAMRGFLEILNLSNLKRSIEGNIVVKTRIEIRYEKIC